MIENMQTDKIELYNIQSLSYSKLAEYDHTRTDLPIRKFVLITNLLREPTIISPQQELEQEWFDNCIDELDQQQEENDYLENYNYKSTIILHLTSKL